METPLAAGDGARRQAGPLEAGAGRELVFSPNSDEGELTGTPIM
jgi:hypothetical protein